MPGNTKTKTNTSATIDTHILKAAKRRAKLECRSFSSLMEFVLWKYCADHGDFRDRAKDKASRKA